tara:strand:+ start:373 stop:642 length:270 start_codon:yes stop_codon:yes gene_type:complete
MIKHGRMENNFLIDVVGDFVLVFISITGTLLGLDSLPQQETLIQIINSPNQTATSIDSIQKIMTIFSLCISTVAGFIPIIKFCKRNKNK